ncbi:WD40-repeat-containing domain protein [Gilbertella persicaria]|uniref:WD40-repeat-containing domain protein n=1 Tax=Gilbertella persicaria TaxID=101096 RepID=UPI00221EF313|nr:WD40-repeat-containing domain protein [Gilbertella persicaria]KAI8056509.1 WD40-repeat-containing domain protein [Gilbertella persicaria]
MPVDTKSSLVNKKTTETTSVVKNNYTAATQAAFIAAKEKATSVVHSAREWITPSGEWSSLTQLESLSTVMFSPLAAHPVYRSESMVKAIQLMQQQQHRQQTTGSSTSLISPRRDLVLHGKSYAWPSSIALLEADIPETNNPVSLFQGFATAYPSLAKSSRSPKHEKQPSRDTPKSLTQIIAERERRVRECDKISMQKSSTANGIEQINLQINELLSKRQALEQKWEKLEQRDIELQLIIDDLNEAVMDIEEGGSNVTSSRQLRSERERDFSDDEEYESGTCFKTLEGHTDDILCIDFNHPKGMLISSSLDGTVRAWDLYRNRCLGNLEGHNGNVRCMQLKEARLLTGSDDSTIKQWDLSLIRPLTSSSSSVFSSEPSSPSLTAVDGGIVTETFTLEGHSSEITALDANLHSAVSGSNDKTIRQWDLETQQCILTLDVMWASKSSNRLESWIDTALNYGYAAHDFVGALQFWDFALASGTSDGKIRMWDLRTGQAHRTLPGHSAPITCLQFDEVHLVSGSLDKTIKIWDLRTGSVFDTLTYPAPVSSLQFDSSKIISSGTSNTIDVYNRTSFQHTTFSGHKSRINSIQFHHDVLASAGSDKVIKLWSI